MRLPAKMDIKKIFQKQQWLGVTAVALLIAIGIIFLVQSSMQKTATSKAPSSSLATSTVVLLPRALDGVLAPDGQENFLPIAIMIDNSLEGRPTIGLSKANLVYEALAEGGITRFFAFFSSGGEISKIGPVRSVRPYFLEWAKEISALPVHIGGSPQALEMISSSRLVTLNEFYQTAYFWRDKDRIAPFNVETSLSLIRKFLENKKIPDQGNFQKWLYKDEAPVKEAPVSQIAVNFSTPAFRVTWQYSSSTNEYLRQQGGTPHLNGNNEQLRAKNIVVQFVRSWVIDQEWRRRIETTGKGEALIFQDGRAIKAKWQKQNSKERTRFFDENEQEISFNRGITWVEVVPIGHAVEY